MVDQRDPRYQAMSDAVRAPEERMRESKLNELANLREELAKAVTIAKGLDTEFWKVLRDDFIKPNSSIRKIHASAGEKRIEAIGETKILNQLLDWVVAKVKGIQSLRNRIQKLERELSERQPPM